MQKGWLKTEFTFTSSRDQVKVLIFLNYTLFYIGNMLIASWEMK